jgi:hypothetical protein
MKNPYLLDEYFHVIKTENKLEVVSSKFSDCKKVKDSIASFINREFAVNHLNSKKLK